MAVNPTPGASVKATCSKCQAEIRMIFSEIGWKAVNPNLITIDQGPLRRIASIVTREGEVQSGLSGEGRQQLTEGFPFHFPTCVAPMPAGATEEAYDAEQVKQAPKA